MDITSEERLSRLIKNQYTRAGRCESAWVVARLLREYRASIDSQTSGRGVRPTIACNTRHRRETGSPHHTEGWCWVVHLLKLITLLEILAISQAVLKN